MAFLGLYPIVVSTGLWRKQLMSGKMLFYCDNIATVQIIKKWSLERTFNNGIYETADYVCYVEKFCYF
jgi:hypothetical protein